MARAQPWGMGRQPQPVYTDTFEDPARPEIAPVTLSLRRPLYTERAAIWEEAERRADAWEAQGRHYPAIDGGGNVLLTRKAWQTMVALEALQCDADGKRLPLEERYSADDFIGWSVASEVIFEGMTGLLATTLTREGNGHAGNSSGTDADGSSAPSVPTVPVTSVSTVISPGASTSSPSAPPAA
jgi:hypothetical protein